MSSSYFPLRWESTGDQWWFATPIDCAAANGHYELVSELLRIDTNLLIKLTSLRRIRRLETVWDDNESQFQNVAKCRAFVARKLLQDCENNGGKNSLIRAGYGGWLLYTAASSGDIYFVKELLKRDPLLVFGEGEYGVTDILYAAAKSKNTEVFMLLFDLAINPRNFMENDRDLDEVNEGDVSAFKWEIMNRAVHAAARGGNLGILKNLIRDVSDVLSYRDLQGSTILHAASGSGQVEVVKDLVSTFDTINCRDNQGNTALHVAAYRGHLSVAEFLVISSPHILSLANLSGDTFLHVAIAGFRAPGFHRLDRQMEFVKKFISEEWINVKDFINVVNNEGRTVLHMAVAGNVHCDLVDLLISLSSIDLNIKDIYGMTPLDLVRQNPRSASLEILIKRLILSGGISNSDNYLSRTTMASHLKTQGMCPSPGTSFRISDSEIFLYTGIEDAFDSDIDRVSGNGSFSDDDNDRAGSTCNDHISTISKKSSLHSAARHLRIFLQWSRKKDKKCDTNSIASFKTLPYSAQSCKDWSESENIPTPLRERFSKTSAMLDTKRVIGVPSYLPSPNTKEKFSAGLMQGVIQATPDVALQPHSPYSALSMSPAGSPTLLKKTGGDGFSLSYTSVNGETQHSNVMNHYFCYGTQGLSTNNGIGGKQSNQSYRRSILSMI